MFEQPVEFGVNVGQALLQHFFQLVEQYLVLFGAELAFPAERPQATADRLRPERVVFRAHVRTLEQGHVTQLHSPEIDLIVTAQASNDFVDANLLFEIFVTDQRDVRSRQTAGLVEAALHLERNQLIVRRPDFLLKSLKRRRLRDAAELHDFRKPPLQQFAAVTLHP